MEGRTLRVLQGRLGSRLNIQHCEGIILHILRVSCPPTMASRTNGSLTRPANDEYVAVPLGLVAVFWLRQFKPVLQATLPQMPNNIGLDGLGFVKDAYRRITQLSHLDFRVAARFTGRDALFVQAIRDAVSHIKVETPSPETV
jgi:hypothetical protein